MDLRKIAGERGRLLRTILTVVLAAVAISSLRKGKRLRGLLAGVGALALGYSVTSGFGGGMETLRISETSEDGQLRCAACGQPIRTGQRRGPNANDEIVHDACMATAE